MWFKNEEANGGRGDVIGRANGNESNQALHFATFRIFFEQY